ncbi:hypothetical protein KCU81_g3696, partial [Aureobasidium melanogenum]|uniref:R3H domain-containing protein n=1 Tax=Aureobasidium melanogenum (strain CBS 110374) TaxID=1043003 RepID=A0A074VNB2_AURM1
MSSAAPTIITLSPEDLEQVRVCIKSRALQEKLSAIKNPHGAILMTAAPNPTSRLLSMFEDDAKEKLSSYLKDPTQPFTTLQSMPLTNRDQRREAHNLIRQVSNDKLDSGLDNETCRINVFVRNIPSKQQENQRPRQQKAQKKRTPAKAASNSNANGIHKATPRNKPAARSLASRITPSKPLTTEQKAKLAKHMQSAAQVTAQREAAAKPHPVKPFEFKKMDWSQGEITYKYRAGTEKEPELTSEEIDEQAERKRNAVPPHRRGAASQAREDE